MPSYAVGNKLTKSSEMPRRVSSRRPFKAALTFLIRSVMVCPCTLRKVSGFWLAVVLAEMSFISFRGEIQHATRKYLPLSTGETFNTIFGPPSRTYACFSQLSIYPQFCKHFSKSALNQPDDIAINMSSNNGLKNVRT